MFSGNESQVFAVVGRVGTKMAHPSLRPRTLLPSFPAFSRVGAAALPMLAAWSLRSSVGTGGWKDIGPARFREAAPFKGPSPVSCPELYLSFQSPGIQGCSSCPTAWKCSWRNTCSCLAGMLWLWVLTSLLKCCRT